ncbi:MAG: hypothetical protein IJQ02_03245 [Oscillospiraceae bacterium]|nr:hypothetical protein [Oscillospiraceae bacterium]
MMYAVIDQRTDTVLQFCKTKEAAILAAQLEKEKMSLTGRNSITAVAMDDGGFTDILF